MYKHIYFILFNMHFTYTSGYTFTYYHVHVILFYMPFTYTFMYTLSCKPLILFYFTCILRKRFPPLLRAPLRTPLRTLLRTHLRTNTFIIFFTYPWFALSVHFYVHFDVNFYVQSPLFYFTCILCSLLRKVLVTLLRTFNVHCHFI